MTEDAARKQAKREASFYRSLGAFVVVNLFLVAINLLTSPGTFWAIWSILGWGFAIATQAFATFGRSNRGDWVDRRTQELMGAEASEQRLRAMLDETLDERAIPAGEPQDAARLQRRIEHLEAIVTSRDWDEIRTDGAAEPPRLGDLLDDLPDGPADGETEAARIARRVR
ncbi:MAG: 2TM domain-containing protein [Bacteroidota bacterium]